MAFAKECADLALPLARDIADWVEAGKPASRALASERLEETDPEELFEVLA